MALWDRIAKTASGRGESPKAYAAFCVFRDMKPFERSVAATARELGRDYSWVNEWAHKYDWRRRAEAWDGHLEEAGRRAQMDAVIEMNDRHARIAMATLQKVAQRLVGDEANEVQAIDPNDLSASDLAKLAEVATKIERLARGEETERLGANVRGDTVVRLAFEVAPYFPDESDPDRHRVEKPDDIEGVVVHELPPGDEDEAA
jgi:hypothetical protein